MLTRRPKDPRRDAHRKLHGEWIDVQIAAFDHETEKLDAETLELEQQRAEHECELAEVQSEIERLEEHD